MKSMEENRNHKKKKRCGVREMRWKSKRNGKKGLNNKRDIIIISIKENFDKKYLEKNSFRS